MTTLELIEKHGIGHNCLSDAYELGRANGYSQAETDYHKQTEKDRQSAYDCGYEQGRKDTLEICKVLFCKYAKGRDLGEIEILLDEIKEIDK